MMKQESYSMFAKETIILFERMKNTFLAKNKDYGNSFQNTYEKYGIISALTRMSDKWNRIETLALSGADPEVEDEKLEDTLLDLANYAAMTVAAIKCEKVKNLPKVPAALSDEWFRKELAAAHANAMEASTRKYPTSEDVDPWKDKITESSSKEVSNA